MIMVAGEWVAAGDLIDAAIQAWQTGSSDYGDAGQVASLLDGLNNMSGENGTPGVPYLVPYEDADDVCGDPYTPFP
jgi:hypothetical protein